MVNAPGHYCVLTVNGSYVVEYLKPGYELGHFVQQIMDGPFDDLTKPDGKQILSGHRLATTRLSEILAGEVNKGWVQKADSDKTDNTT
jgi:hypothetical protein